MTHDDLVAHCQEVLKTNDRGTHTVPAGGLYPHQWLWDSCFIAIGLRHYDVKRAQKEIVSLLRGQWRNGMLPNMILTNGMVGSRAGTFWRSGVSPYSPDSVATSGITQPPMLAEAIVSVGTKLRASERYQWYLKVYPALLAYHQWLYRERSPSQNGLILLVHPWETGLDNTPPWMYELHKHSMPTWIKSLRALHLDRVITLLRSDTRSILPGERLSTLDGLLLYSLQRRLRRRRYDIHAILKSPLLSIEDVTFNAILIRANSHLRSIAKTLKRPLPSDLSANMELTETNYEQLWDAYSGHYYSRNAINQKLIKVPSIGTLLPLYAGHIPKARATELVKLLRAKDAFGAQYPVPSVPLNSSWFNHHLYWQGPTWINTNWLIIDGLKRYGFNKEADQLRSTSLELVARHGSYEYFSPIDGSQAGAKNFSWTAALTIDLVQSHQK